MIGAVRSGVYMFALSALCLSFSSASYADDISNSKISTPVLSEQDIVILEVSDVSPDQAIVVKHVVIDDSLNRYSYAELLDSLKRVAKNERANILKVNTSIARNQESISDYIVATLYYSQNPHQFEQAFSWHPQRRLTWNDFRGPVLRDMNDIRAAGTFCGIGFETNRLGEENNNAKVYVYNTFYVNKSWIKELDKNDLILAHEQGHFDLCEIYTRKMRAKLNEVIKTTDKARIKNALENAYNEVQSEYAARQQQYEDETEHGVIDNVQQHWQIEIAKELKETEQWTESNVYAQK